MAVAPWPVLTSPTLQSKGFASEVILVYEKPIEFSFWPFEFERKWDLRRLFLALMAVIFLSSQGVGSFSVQVYAWSKMFWTFTQSASLEVAWAKTFNGKNPCHLCKNLKKSQDRQAFQALVLESSSKAMNVVPSIGLMPVELGRFLAASDPRRPLSRGEAPLERPPSSC